MKIINNLLRFLLFFKLFLILSLPLYGQIPPGTYVSPKGEQVVAQYEAIFEITNHTDVAVTMEIRQNFRNDNTPYNQRVYEKFYFEPREAKAFSFPVKVDPANPTKAWFVGSCIVEDKEYGKAGFSLERDRTRLTENSIQGYLYRQMTYPGDELWPPVDPFPVIILEILGE
ncbi:MAG: hypothetical protein ACE5HI_12085 [bacterium]